MEGTIFTRRFSISSGFSLPESCSSWIQSRMDSAWDPRAARVASRCLHLVNWLSKAANGWIIISTNQSCWPLSRRDLEIWMICWVPVENPRIVWTGSLSIRTCFKSSEGYIRSQVRSLHSADQNPLLGCCMSGFRPLLGRQTHWHCLSNFPPIIKFERKCLSCQQISYIIFRDLRITKNHRYYLLQISL